MSKKAHKFKYGKMHFTVYYKCGCLKVNFEGYLWEWVGCAGSNLGSGPIYHDCRCKVHSQRNYVNYCKRHGLPSVRIEQFESQRKIFRENRHRRILLNFPALFQVCLKMTGVADTLQKYLWPLTKWHTLPWLPSLSWYSVFVPFLWLSKLSVTISFCQYLIAC